MVNLPDVNPFFQISAPLQILPAFVHSTGDSGSILLVCSEFIFVVFKRVSLLGKFPHLASSRTPLPTALYYLRGGYESQSTNTGIWELEFYNLTLFLFGAPIFRSIFQGFVSLLHVSSPSSRVIWQNTDIGPNRSLCSYLFPCVYGPIKSLGFLMLLTTQVRLPQFLDAWTNEPPFPLYGHPVPWWHCWSGNTGPSSPRTPRTSLFL